MYPNKKCRREPPLVHALADCKPLNDLEIMAAKTSLRRSDNLCSNHLFVFFSMWVNNWQRWSGQSRCMQQQRDFGRNFDQLEDSKPQINQLSALAEVSPQSRTSLFVTKKHKLSVHF
jgi:hypothetical protein